MTKNKKEHSEQKNTIEDTDQTSTKDQQNSSPNDELLFASAKIVELTDTLQRLQAEFENYKKRIDKENIQLVKNSNAELIKELLPVLDSFELAIKNSNNIDNPEVVKFKKGMEMIYAQLFSIMEEYGLRPLDTKNKKFDPYLHEVLMVKELDDKDDDIILQEFQKGYMLNDLVLRHSKVMISRKKENNAYDKDKGDDHNCDFDRSKKEK